MTYGIADLPLHSGRVPLWMLKYMEKMARSIVRVLIELRGEETLINGLSDPLWFQAFNNIIGMDWDSSGSTTVLTAILKKISWEEDLGFIVLGGKGQKMREIPVEAEFIFKGRSIDLDPEMLSSFSKIAARVDSSLLQDGYDLYHHTLIATNSSLLVIQQGMNAEKGLARRYHVRHPRVEEPHSGIAGVRGPALDLSSRNSRRSRKIMLEVLAEGPRKAVKDFYEAYRILRGLKPLAFFIGGAGLEDDKTHKRRIAYYKPVRPSRTVIKGIEDLARFQPSSELDLLLAPKLGPQVVRALALVAELVYSAPPSKEDPVTHPIDPYIFSYAVGGKDRVPYPFNKKTAAKTALILEEAILEAKVDKKEKERMLKRLRDTLRGL